MKTDVDRKKREHRRQQTRRPQKASRRGFSTVSNFELRKGRVRYATEKTANYRGESARTPPPGNTLTRGDHEADMLVGNQDNKQPTRGKETWFASVKRERR